MRGTSGEGLEATLSTADPQDSSDDEEVGGENKHDGSNDIRGKYKIEHNLVAFLHVTGQLYKWGKITKEIINNIVPTEAQGKCLTGNDGGVKKATKA